MKKFSAPIFYAALLLLLLGIGCGRIREAALGRWAPQFSSYQNGHLINAAPKTAFQIPAKDKNGDALQFMAVGCAGSGNQGQKVLAEEMAGLASQEKTSFVLYLGDNFYPRGVNSVQDKQWKSKFEDIYYQDSLQIPFYAILGNHDYHGNPQVQIDYSAASSRWKMPSRYYSFDRSLKDSTVVSFFALDSEEISRGKGEKQLAWLDEKLAASPAKWKIVFGHHPLYTSDSRYGKKTGPIKKALEPLFQKYHVQLYLCAHSHNLEVLKPVSGVHYVVSGAGSRPRDLTWSENTLFASTNIGFAYIRISAARMDIEIIGEKNKINYAFSISE